MASILYDQNGNVANANPNGGQSFPLQSPRAPNQGVNAAGEPVPIAPGATMGVRATAHTGTMRLVIGGSAEAFAALENLGPQRFRAEDIQPSDAGIAGTAKTISGAPLPASELRDDSLVTLPGSGMKTTAAAAARLGFLRRSPTGGYENVGPTVQPSTTAPAPAPSTTVNPPAAPTKEPIQADSVPTLSGSAQASALLLGGVESGLVTRALLDLAEGGQVNDTHIERAASQLSLHPETVRANLAAVVNGHIDQAAEHLANQGVDAAKMYDWARSSQPEALKTAMLDHGRTGNVRAWDGLASQFVAGLETRDPAAAIAYAASRGFKASKDPNGNAVIVEVPGQGQTSFTAAFRAGILNTKGRR